MTGFVDLVKRAQPALLGGGCELRPTEGRDWEWVVKNPIVDDEGDPIDFTAVDGTCTAYTEAGQPVFTILYTGNADGTFVLSKTAADSAGLGSNKTDGRKLRMDFYMTGSGVTVAGWTRNNSYLIVQPGD